jgi:hypothetical protein
MKTLSTVESSIYDTCTKLLKTHMQKSPLFVLRHATYGDIYKSLEFANEIPGSINSLDHAITYNNPFYKHLKELVFSRLLPIYVADMTQKLVASLTPKKSLIIDD